MALLYFDEIFLEHDPGDHPDSKERLLWIRQGLIEAGLWDEQRLRPATPATVEQITAVHSPDYVELIEKLAARGGGHLTLDTLLSVGSYEAARHAAGTVIAAAEAVLGGEDTTALCLVRPPGHHATPRGGMGFCLFNNIAIAVRHLQATAARPRVLIVDWDLHHGNGLQETFYEDAEVFYFSLHRSPFYPGTGQAEETGRAAGEGFTLNLPLARGTSREEYLAQFERGLQKVEGAFAPEFVFVAAGFDTGAGDPFGGFGLEPEDYATMTRRVKQLAAGPAGGRIVSSLEGGYAAQGLSAAVAAHFRALQEE